MQYILHCDPNKHISFLSQQGPPGQHGPRGPQGPIGGEVHMHFAFLITDLDLDATIAVYDGDSFTKGEDSIHIQAL